MGLIAKHCKSCDQLLSTDKYHCPVCFSEQLEERKLSGKGEIYSFTNIYAAPKPFNKDAPYYVVLVDLEEGLRVTARYSGEEIGIGEKVVIDYIDERAYYFKPANKAVTR